MSKQCPKKGKAAPTTPAIRTTEASAEPAPVYDRPALPREQEGSGGSAFDLIRLMNDEEHTKLLDDLCVEQGF
jgi:hypothetical protein